MSQADATSEENYKAAVVALEETRSEFAGKAWEGSGRKMKSALELLQQIENVVLDPALLTAENQAAVTLAQFHLASLRKAMQLMAVEQSNEKEHADS